MADSNSRNLSSPPLGATAAPTAAAAPIAAASGVSVPASAPITFSHKITEKLDGANFLLWRQQIEPVIKGHRLHQYLVNPHIPPRFLTQQDRDDGRMNPEYSAWEQQDQLLMSWLQSTLSSSVLSRVIGCVHSWELWEKLLSQFTANVQA